MTNSSSSGALRIGVLGAATIARLFAEAVRPSAKVVVAAVASRESERAMAFARALGIARVHASYDALLADPEIDAVYAPLPNNLHAQWSVRAANAGKHVLCEKPLAAIGAEARAMFLAEAESFHDLVRFGWKGWTGVTPAESIDIAMTLEALAVSGRQGVQAEVGRQTGG